jgi:hypothetical protein
MVKKKPDGTIFDFMLNKLEQTYGERALNGDGSQIQVL